MLDSYSNRLIRFVLENYIDIASGHIPLKKASDEGFLKSVGRRNPMETFLVWRSDVDRSISALAPKHDIWCEVSREFTPELARLRVRDLSRRQQEVVMCYIFCDWVEDFDTPYNITIMRHFLNGNKRDESGKWIKSAAKLTVSKGIDTANRRLKCS